MVRKKYVDIEKLASQVNEDLIASYLKEVLYQQLVCQGVPKSRCQKLFPGRLLIPLIHHIIARLTDLLLADIATSFVLIPSQKKIILNQLNLIKEEFLKETYIERVIVRQRLLRLGLAKLMKIHYRRTKSFRMTKRSFLSEAVTRLIKESIIIVILNEFCAVLSVPQLMHPLAEDFLLRLMEEDYARALYYDNAT